MKNIICNMLSEGPQKKRESASWRTVRLAAFFGWIFFVSFFDQAKKERIINATLATYKPIFTAWLF